MSEGNFIGALTTTFTPPATCADLTISSISSVFRTTVYLTDSSGSTTSTSSALSTSTTAYIEQYDYVLDPACYPNGDRMTSSAYYSPGICPDGWSGIATTVKNEETTVNCCPSEYTIDDVLCKSTVSGYPTLPVVLYLGGDRIDATPTPSALTGGTVWASGIQVRFRAGDFDVTSSSESSSTTGPTSSSSQSTGPAIPTDPPTPHASTGLSTGAKIGIGIGVPLAAIGLGILAFFIFWRHRKSKQSVSPNVAPAPMGAAGSYNGPPGGPQPQVMQGGPPMMQAQPPQYSNGAQGPHYQGIAQTVPVGAPGYFEGDKNPQHARASEIYTPGQGLGSPQTGYDNQQQQQRYSTVSGGVSPQMSTYQPVSQGYVPQQQQQGYLQPQGASPPLNGSPPQAYQAYQQAPSPVHSPAPGGGQAPVEAPAPMGPGRQTGGVVHEVDGGQGGWRSGAGPLPSAAELYPDHGVEEEGARR